MKQQTLVLAERYLDTFLADWTSLFFLVFQPLAVAYFTGIIWQGQTSGKTLYFVLVFSALFFGCVNACREIVRERAIWERERLIGISIPAYILSKFSILSLMGGLQTLIFFFALRYFLVLKGAAVLMILLLYLTLLSGTAMGLLISAFVKTDVMALALVPVVLIPQLLFSKLVLPAKTLTGVAHFIEQATLIKWSYLSMEKLVFKFEFWPYAQGQLVLLGLSLIMLCGTGLILKFREV